MTVFTELQARALTAIRRATPRHDWDRIADIVVKDRQKVEAHLKAEPPQDNFRRLLEPLRSQSHVQIPISVPNLAELRRYFELQPVYKGSHVFSFDGRPQAMSDVRPSFPMAGYTSDQVLRAPGQIGRAHV